MRKSTILLSTVALVLLAGCTAQEPDPDQPSTPAALAPTLTPGAETACGIDVTAVELMIGRVVTRTRDEVRITQGVGSGVCHAYTEDGNRLWVTLSALSDPEAVRVRRQLNGEVMNPPNVVFDPGEADGGVWGDGVIGAGSSVFWGPTMIRVSVNGWTSDRDIPADLLAATHQVADFYGLERPSPS